MTRSGVSTLCGILFATCLIAGSSLESLHAQPVGPPPPKEYKVEIRYRIRAGRNERVTQFRALTRYLESIGFQKDPGPEDEAENPNVTTMTGTIASANARKLLRDRHIESILLMPQGYNMPANGEDRVKVNVGLASLFTIDRQRLLGEQVAMLLQTQGFREAIGYDHRGYTRLAGTIPADKLPRLLSDLRWQSSGWLAPAVPVAMLPAPLNDVWPVEVIEVVPEPEGTPPPKEFAPEPRLAPEQTYLLKIGPDLRAIADQDRIIRMEILLGTVPSELDPGWQDRLQRISGGLVEGHAGPLVTLKAPANRAPLLAQLPGVVAVRLPRPAFTQAVVPNHSQDAAAALQAVGLDRYHAAGRRGQGIRVAIIDNDFRGYEQFLGNRLSAKTRLLDVTAECNPDVRPSPYPDDGVTIGHGTQAALALALAAPAADITLVRIANDAPYQLVAVSRYLRGEPVRSECLQQRREELTIDSNRLDRIRETLLEERRAVLDQFGQDPATARKREAYFQRQVELERLNQELQARQQRYLRLAQDLLDLRGIPVAACALVWNDGYPVDGGSVLSQYFDGQAPQPPLWFQNAGNAGRQAWAGLFRDADGNGVMEFAPIDSTGPRPGRWTTELNFLGWQPLSGSTKTELPKGRVRVSVQWREPHDPAIATRPDDPYRIPLADLQLVILRQRDPTGTRLPTDDLEAVARSSGLPLRITNESSSAMYEQTVEFTVDAPGNYALRIEGRVPRSIRPADFPTLPSLETIWELWPRCFVDAVDGQTRNAGRLVFFDYATSLGNLGTPADARANVTIGAADRGTGPEPYTSGGPPLGEALLIKPDALVADGIDTGLPLPKTLAGSEVSAAFAAGAAACALSAHVPAEEIIRSIRAKQGKLLRLP